MARTGLAFTEVVYERERYEQILARCAQALALLSAGHGPDDENLAARLREGWLAQVTPGVKGYVTPKIGTAGLCFSEDGRMLLGRRADNGIWFYPTGWLEVGLTPAENVVKEVAEETGIDCRPLRLLGVKNMAPGQGYVAAGHYLSMFFLCAALHTDIAPRQPHETLEAGFFGLDDTLAMTPQRIHGAIRLAFAAWRGEPVAPYFDPIEP